MVDHWLHIIATRMTQAHRPETALGSCHEACRRRRANGRIRVGVLLAVLLLNDGLRRVQSLKRRPRPRPCRSSSRRRCCGPAPWQCSDCYRGCMPVPGTREPGSEAATPPGPVGWRTGPGPSVRGRRARPGPRARGRRAVPRPLKTVTVTRTPISRFELAVCLKTPARH